jgi:hypothetical protein
VRTNARRSDDSMSQSVGGLNGSAANGNIFIIDPPRGGQAGTPSMMESLPAGTMRVSLKPAPA